MIFVPFSTILARICYMLMDYLNWTLFLVKGLYAIGPIICLLIVFLNLIIRAVF